MRPEVADFFFVLAFVCSVAYALVVRSESKERLAEAERLLALADQALDDALHAPVRFHWDPATPDQPGRTIVPPEPIEGSDSATVTPPAG